MPETGANAACGVPSSRAGPSDVPTPSSEFREVPCNMECELKLDYIENHSTYTFLVRRASILGAVKCVGKE